MAEIEKIAVYDARIIQDPPKYGVQKGALSVSTSQFQATAASASQLQFQVLVPSLNVFTDRKIELNASPYVYAEAVPSQIVKYDTNGYYIQSPSTASQCYTIQDQPIPASYPPPGTLPQTLAGGPTAQYNGGNSACVLPADSWPGLTGSSQSSSYNASRIIHTFPVGVLGGWPSGTGTNQALPIAAKTIDNPLAGKNPISGTFSMSVNLQFKADLRVQPLQVWQVACETNLTTFFFEVSKFPAGKVMTDFFAFNQRVRADNFPTEIIYEGRKYFQNMNGVIFTQKKTAAGLNLISTQLGVQVYSIECTGDFPKTTGFGLNFLLPAGTITAIDVPRTQYIPDPPASLMQGEQTVNIIYTNDDKLTRPAVAITAAQATWYFDTTTHTYTYNIQQNVPLEIDDPEFSTCKKLGMVIQDYLTFNTMFGRDDVKITEMVNSEVVLYAKSGYSSTAGGSNDNYYQSIGGPSDLSLGMFPIQTLAKTMTGTINDCTVSVTGDTFHEQLLISQTRDSLMQRTCASKFDVYAWSQDDARANSGAIQAYDNTKDSDIPNGSSAIVFVDPTTGRPFQQFDAYKYTLASGAVVTVPVINYRPAFIPFGSNLVGQIMPSSTLTYLNPNYPATSTVQYLPGWPIVATECSQPVPVMFTFQSVEPLCLSPLLWQDSKQMTEVGLYGTTNMTLNMTLSAPGASQGYEKSTVDISTLSPAVGRLYMDKLSNSTGSYSYMTRQSGINALFGNMRLQPPVNNLGNQTGPWVSVPRLLCTFLTPPPEITLPLVSSVPYVEFPRYNSTAVATVNPNGTFQVASNTITLSSIPDTLVVFVRPSVRGQTQGDTYIPISNIAVTFDNYSNLCNNYSQEDLYACSVASGLDMDFNQFRGFARGRFPTLTPASSGRSGTGLFDTYQATSGMVQLTGSPVLLRMGQDIPLSSGLAPGTLGNYSVQVNLTLDNRNGFFNYLASSTMASTVNITIMAVNSGFFESVRGSSAIRKTILNTNDVEAASTSNSVTSSQLVRMVGGASGMHTSSRLTTSMGVPSIKVGHGDERMRKMARHSSMLS